MSDMKKVLVKLLEKPFDSGSNKVIVTCEPVVVLGTIYKNGIKVISRIEVVLSTGSIVAIPPPLDENYILLEVDAWGEAREIWPLNSENLSSLCRTGFFPT
ncbi:MAG: hypothetical protein RXO29_00625 [Desulfurococcales archaeon]